MDHSSPGSMLLPVLIFLTAAVIAAPLFRFLRLGSVIGYLVAGVAIGPAGLGLIGDTATVAHVAEFGVVLLLFIIGLELEPARLLAMRRDILGLGSLQMAVTALALGFGLSALLGVSVKGSIIAGLALAFSSTAIAMQLLEERGAIESAYGRRAFAVLLMQDVLVAPVLALAPLLAGGSSGTLTEGVLAFGGAVAAFAAVIVAGRYVLNPCFAVLARSGAREAMAAAALLVVLGAALLMEKAGLSMALGAFLAGLLLSESNFRHQLEADIEPFRGLLMGLFFMSVGMAIDGRLVMSNAGTLILVAFAIVLAKGVVAFALMRMTGSRNCDSVSGASTLTTAGEFAFVVFPVAMAGGLLTATQAGLLSAATALTMAAGPLTAKLLDVFAARLRPAGEPAPAEEVPEEARGSVLVIGFGRFGQIAVQVLLAGRANVTVIDRDMGRIRNAARFGFKVFYGDGTRLDVLRSAGGEQARIIAVCVDRADEATKILEICKAHFPLARVHVRAYDRIHALKLLEARADFQLRETFESAVQFGGAAFAALSGDRERARELAAHVRRLDNERLALQQAGAAYAELAPWLTIQPEPLTRTEQKARPLSVETADIVSAAEKTS